MERAIAELSLGVRLRVALDVLERLAEEGAPLARRSAASRMRLARIAVDEEGMASVPGEGDASGVLELTWELLAARVAPSGALGALDEVPRASPMRSPQG